VQPLPWERSEGEGPSGAKKLGSIWENHSDFLLAGFFNGLDFLASNTAFSRSAASFVETIKSSDPITTTAVALAWNVDRLARTEAVALSLLIVGVMLSTWGNSQSPSKNGATLEDSISGASIVIVANFRFAFRAMFQKRYQAAAGDMQMDDINLLCRMQQTGAAALLLPVIVACTGFIIRGYHSLPHSAKMYYVGLSAANAFFYAVYK
jgi:drug/metabolite transporter (DMT)-like permease